MKVNTYIGCVLFVIIFGSQLGKAQNVATRYKEEIFTEIKETKDVIFSTNVPQPVPGGGIYEIGVGKFWDTPVALNAKEHETANVDLKMDIFEPVGDLIKKRPVVILCFGGAFAFGEKEFEDMRITATDLAKRGFVTASIEYRIGINIFDAKAVERAIYRTVQDSRAAVRFFRADAAQANLYNIDPEHIYIAGYSSGGFAALHNVYMDKETERPVSTYTTTCSYSEVPFDTLSYEVPDLGCLDCVGDNQKYNGRANGAISFAGAINHLEYIEGGEDRPCLLFHSTDDPAVPYFEGQPFAWGKLVAPTLAINDTYGGGAIYEYAQKIGLHAKLYTYEDRKHAVLFEPEQRNKVYTEMVPRTARFLYELLPLPQDTGIVIDLPQIYPNPSPRTFHIKVPHPTVSRILVRVFNKQNRLVYQGSLTKQNNEFILDLDNLPKGEYYLNIQTDSKEYSTKIIKQL